MSPQNRTRSKNTSSITPSAAFGKTLQFITKIKLHELQQQRLAYDKHSEVLAEANAAGDDLVRKVEILLRAVRSWSGSGSIPTSGVVGTNLSLSNLDMWLAQAKTDPSFSSDVVQGWVRALEEHITHTGTRFEYATLFGNLFNEWVESEGSSAGLSGEEDGNEMDHNDGGVSADAEEFVAVGRKELHEQKEQLTALIFEEKVMDTEALTSYLDELFSGKETQTALEALRNSNGLFCYSLARKTIAVDDVRWIVRSLLSSDLLDNEKRSTLREFLDSPTILNEVASVLNMRLAAFSTWSWPPEGVAIEMRRHLNGKYRAFMDSEIIDALFLEFVGKSLQVQFKKVFREFFNSRAWKPAFKPLSKAQLDRRTSFLGAGSTSYGIQSFRREMQESSFLMSQLPDNLDSSPSYDGDADNREEAKKKANPVAIKQTLLHLMATECYLNKTLHGSHTVVRTDLEWFGPSLPHDSILLVLSYFGVTEPWLDFFRAFLATPLRFVDDPTGEVRERKRGAPISHALSSLCGEVILFGMDFAVNQRADGLFLYRIHDDLWFWDSKPEKCVAAWKEMNTYASLVGLKFNASKTGAACLGGDVHPDLPLGDIRWGFLKFDVGSAGRFVIDQDQVDVHIVELRRQLAATKSVFGWINAYNKYIAFFFRNFGGRPADCFGAGHADDMVDTLARIQRELFPEEGGAIGHLRRVIGERFGMHDLPQGYFLFPVGSGGLELLNPLIELHAMRSALSANPEMEFTRTMEKDAETYRRLKETWESSTALRMRLLSLETEFMPFKEYVLHREIHLTSWRDKYSTLLDTPSSVHVDFTPALDAAVRSLPASTDSGSTQWLTGTMSYYQKWIVSLYAEEMIKKFGSLSIVDPTLIPVGMVQLFKSSRMRWEQ